MLNKSKSDTPEKCTLAITEFVNAIRPTRYSTDGLVGGALLEAEYKLNLTWPYFETLSEEEWSIVRRQISRTDEMILWYYAVRMAELAVRKNDEMLIRFGLIALIVDEKYSEQRDFFTALVLLLDAAKRINANINLMFKQLAKLGTPSKRETIEKYVDERAAEQSFEYSLESIGYAAEGFGDTFTYRSII